MVVILFQPIKHGCEKLNVESFQWRLVARPETSPRVVLFYNTTMTACYCTQLFEPTFLAENPQKTKIESCMQVRG